MSLEDKTVKELREMAGDVEGVWDMKKAELIDVVKKQQEPKKESVEDLKAENERLKNKLEIGTEKTIDQIREDNKEMEVQDTKPLEEGFKNPSIANQIFAHDHNSYKKLIEAYKKQNPAKYEQKKVELEEKLKRLK